MNVFLIYICNSFSWLRNVDLLFLIRTSVECAATCVASINCYAFRWNGLECNLLSENGLCLDVQNKNPTSVYVDQNDMPLDCIGSKTFWLL